MKIATLLGFLFFSNLLYSQGYSSMGARENGLGNAGLTMSTANSYFFNPGSCANTEHLEISLNYQNRFLLREFSEQSLSAVLPSSKGVFSFGIYHAGSIHFQNNRAGLGYALALSPELFMGVQMNYQGINLPDSYGSSHKMTGEFGILYLINEHWKIGAAVFNFANARLSEYYDDRLTSALKLGVNFAPSKKVQILVDLSKDLDYPMISVHAGAEYAILTNLFLRLGVSTKPETFSLGFGYQLKSFRFDLSTQYHPTLGLKPQFGLVYSK